MLKAIQNFYDRHVAGSLDDSDEAGREHAFQLATAALLMEISRADHDIKQVEREAVLSAVQRVFGLDASETQALVDLAEEEVNEATSLYEFTRLINANFDPNQKQHVVEMLWQVAFADGAADKFEEHLVRRIADLIHVPHKGFIRAKLAAQSARGKDDVPG